ncbi:hypothetical protein FQZ97_867080 [compost metagenome]
MCQYCNPKYMPSVTSAPSAWKVSRPENHATTTAMRCFKPKVAAWRSRSSVLAPKFNTSSTSAPEPRALPR